MNNFDINKTNESVRILAKNCYAGNDTHLTGLNNNDLIIGPSGAGKTRNYVKPNIMQCNESIIVSDTKSSLYGETRRILAENGYDIIHIDFTNFSNSTCGYNPLDFIRFDEKKQCYNEQDIFTVASTLVSKRNMRDPYWENAATQYLACLIAFVLEALPEEEHSLEYVLKGMNMMNKSLNREFASGDMSTYFDAMINELEEFMPDSIAVRRYHNFSQNKNAVKMHSSIVGVLSTNLESLAFGDTFEIFRMENRLDFRRLANRKTALFLTVSDTDSSLEKLINLFYTQALRELCRYADKECEGHHLPVPVRIYLDDFASNIFIPDFDKIISVIRSRDISVSVILQSLSQLEGLYGHAKAMTIVNNCDNFLYLGGQDVDTAHYISQKINLTPTSVLKLPLDRVFLFTRGSEPKCVDKYNIKDHEKYGSLDGELY